MFKKGLLAIAILASMGFFASCAMQQGPLSPSSSLLTQANSNTNEKPTVSDLSGPTSGSLTSPAIFEFQNSSGDAMEMDASTLNSTNIQVYYKTTENAETQLTGISVSYNAALKRVSILPNGNWTDNRRYRVLFTTGIKTAGGAPLDGNGNGVAELATYDNKNMQFVLGSGFTPYVFSALTIDNATVDYVDAPGPGTPSILSDNLNSVQGGAYTYVTITVYFTEPVDPNSVYVDSGTLHSNISILNLSTNSPVSPVNVALTTGDQLLEGVFILPADTTYKLTVLGGTSGVRTAVDGSAALLKGRLFGGETGIAEPGSKVTRYISVVETNTTTAQSDAPPTVASCAYESGITTRVWTVTFNVNSGDPEMDQTTLNASNFQLEAEYNGDTYNVSIKSVEIVNDTTVYLHVPDSFYPASGGSGDTVDMRVNISRNVKSANGIKLDGNGDGIGGLSDDDYRSDTATVSSQK